MEKRYFLNKSNSKWIPVGVKPATKILVSDSVGFFVEILIDGKNTIPFVVGGKQHRGYILTISRATMAIFPKFENAAPI